MLKYDLLMIQARRANLIEFLNINHPGTVVRVNGTLRYAADHHILFNRNMPNGYTNVTDGKIMNAKANFASNNPIDFLVRFMPDAYPNALVAAMALTGTTMVQENTYTPVYSKIDIQKAPIVIPKPYSNNNRLFKYLIEERKFPESIIKELIKRELLYEDSEFHNIIFINEKKNFGETRTSLSNAWVSKHPLPDGKKRFIHGCLTNSDSNAYWWYKPCKERNTEVIYVCEGAIDAVSLYLIHRGIGIDTKCNCYAAINGLKPKGKHNRIDRIVAGAGKAGIKVVLAIDNPEVDKNPEPIKETWEYYNQLEKVIPINKDWNEDWINIFQIKDNQEYKDQFLAATGDCELPFH